MLRWSSCLLAFLLLALPASAQIFDHGQEVAYEMDISLLADRHQLRGEQRLTYTNNSPDTLEAVYYHLYFNAFQPTSMMAERNRHLPDPDSRIVPRIFELGPDEQGWHRVHSLTQDGEEVSWEVNDTVMRVELADPIAPGETTRFEMHFSSQVPRQTRRSGWMNAEGIEYSMTQWYPKLAEYDERGWHADPYVGREFYAPFGRFDVRITAPEEYVLGATGVVQNPEVVGHGYAERTEPVQGDSLTWHFAAERVHDFAWVADPDYIHEQIDGEDGRTYHLLYQPEVADRWEPMSEWTPEIIQTMSAIIGEYPYPQFTVAQGGDGGMEYPMMTLITGRRSPGSLLGVTAHEAGHEWFYGVLATNEADYAWMDEGFTSWLDTEAVAAMRDRSPNHMGSYLNVLFAQDRGLFEPLNTPSDWFQTNVAYGIAAYSGGSMLVNTLRYVMGDSLQLRWLREYYDRYAFEHPTPYDVEFVAEDVSGLRLDWYFEQMTDTDWTLDYALDGLEMTPRGDAVEVTIELERESRAVMPVDILLELEDGSQQWVNVPLSIMQGHKPLGEEWILAEPWPWTFEEHTVTVTVPARVQRAVIDPLGLTPDRNRLNNEASFPLQTAWFQPPRASWFNYSVGLTPGLGYSHQYGAGGGISARGEYLFSSHRAFGHLMVWPQVLAGTQDLPDGLSGSPIDGVDWRFGYTTELPALGAEAELHLETRKQLGFLENRIGISRPLLGWGAGAQADVRLSLVHQANITDRAYGRIETINPFWTADQQRAHLLFAEARTGVRSGDEYMRLSGQVGSVLDNDVSEQFSTMATIARIEGSARKTWQAGPLTFEASTLAGIGTESLIGYKQFRLGLASLEERWRSDGFRQLTAPIERPLDELHAAAFSAAGPVAYALRGETYLDAPIGRSLVSGSMRLWVAPFASGPLSPVRMALFSGAGSVDLNDQGVLADAGIQLDYDLGSVRALRRWTGQSNLLSDLHLSARFPLWVSEPDEFGADEDAFDLRWLVGLQVSPW